MAKIDLKIGSHVFYNNEPYCIYRIVNLSEVGLEHLKTKKLLNAKITELSSKEVPEPPKNIMEYSQQEWDEAKQRFDMIKDIVYKSASKEDISKICAQHNVSHTTLYTWKRRYEQTAEISSLISNKSQRGKKGARIDPKVEAIIDESLETLYLNKQRYSFPRIYSKISRECVKAVLEPPHANTVRNRIKAIHPKEALKRRYSAKLAHEKFSNFEGEYPYGNYPLEVVQIDHTPLDIIVVDKTYRKPLGRPYLTLAIDVYSRMIAGFYLSLQSPGYYNVSQCILSIFSQKDTYLAHYNVSGKWEIFGIPRMIHVDNGQDLVSEETQRACEEFGCSLLKRPVGRPQFASHIERLFGTINGEIHNLPGTTRSNIQERATYDSAKHACYTLDELTQWLIHYIVNIYHTKHHTGIEMSPNDKYQKGILGDGNTPGTGVLPSIIEDLDTIKIALLPTSYRTVQKDGITIDGITYYSDVLRAWIGITDKNNKKIKHKIKQDPLSLRKIYFFDPEIKQYFEIPYRKIYAPDMTFWDLLAAKRYLKENKIKNYSEEDLFEAYEKLERMEKEVKDKQGKVKLRKSQAPKISTIQKSKEIKEEVPEEDDDLDFLFKNITLYKVAPRKNKHET